VLVLVQLGSRPSRAVQLVEEQGRSKPWLPEVARRMGLLEGLEQIRTAGWQPGHQVLQVAYHHLVDHHHECDSDISSSQKLPELEVVRQTSVVVAASQTWELEVGHRRVVQTQEEVPNKPLLSIKKYVKEVMIPPGESLEDGGLSRLQGVRDMIYGLANHRITPSSVPSCVIASKHVSIELFE
jgi:hypothetical protein